MEPAEHLKALRSGADAFLDAAAGALDRPVRSCPGWAMGDLVAHVGTAWGWAAAMLRTGARAERPEAPGADPADALLGWTRQRADEVIDAVDRLGVAEPDHDCWTFGLPRTRRFWVRRMAQETVLHAWDAQDAAGHPVPIDGEVAADGVDEYLTVLLGRCLQRNPGTWSGETVHLHRTDGDGEWLVRLDAGAAEVTRGHAKGDAAIRGPASSLFLWCTGRGKAGDLDGLDVVGDASVVERWSEDIVF